MFHLTRTFLFLGVFEKYSYNLTTNNRQQYITVIVFISTLKPLDVSAYSAIYG